MPKQHTFAVQKDTETETKIETKIVKPTERVESVAETVGWVAELLEACSEFPWLLILLFPLVLWAAWSQKRSGKPSRPISR